ncbi:MAG TPA: site-specific DNA-methyltransferase [Phycisphaerae bacterium]|nr:site-specific DNA-methyltransferase [Phycisphaerae bacterium]
MSRLIEIQPRTTRSKRTARRLPFQSRGNARTKGVVSEFALRSLETGNGMLLIGNCEQILTEIPNDSLDLVITSPPYDGQPKYGNGERYSRDWYERSFLNVTKEILRALKPHGSFVLNYRSRRQGDERGTLQYELVFWLRKQGFLFCEDFVWGKPSPPPGRFNRFLKDAVEYCFHFAKTPKWQFFPEQCLSPARWDAKDRERRKRLAHNYTRVNAPSGQGRKRVQAGPDFVRPSTLLLYEPDFSPNPTRHPARFPLQVPNFFIKLLSQPGQVVLDPFAGTCTTAVAAERLERRWLMIEQDSAYAMVLPSRLQEGR